MKIRNVFLMVLVSVVVAPSSAWATCADGVKSENETAIDCGGPDCPRCDVGKDCLVATDCLSERCLLGVCAIGVTIVPTDVAATLAAQLAKSGVTVTSATLTAASGACGTYSHGPLGIADGVLCTSGQAALAAPPNDKTNAGKANGMPGSTWCTQVAPGATTFDAAVLEVTFDLAAGFDGVGFDFIVGSEEYPEYVGQQYNDVVGVFVNGTNVALDQDGNPITINGPFFSGTKVITATETQYDGSTPRLSGHATLTGGSTGNKLVVAICDAGDSTYDTGVFVAAFAGCQGVCGTAVTFCGDGVRQAGEDCDDGNNAPGDGCNNSCAVEPGYQCTGAIGEKSVCTKVVDGFCGDGKWVPGPKTDPAAEECDDGNDQVGDGCSPSCKIEAGWSCVGVPGQASQCSKIVVPVCGDGTRDANEACDDGNTEGGDGCSADCQAVECGWVCDVTPGAKSTCSVSCGDGVVFIGGGKFDPPTEACDDGNLQPGDGCDASCHVEAGYQCTQVCGEKSTCTPVSTCGECQQCGDACGTSCPATYACSNDGLCVSPTLLDVVGSSDATVLADALVVPATGLTITDRAFVGAACSSGTYTHGPLGIGDGVLLTTGLVKNALPPNDSPGTSTINSSTVADEPYCATLAGTSAVYDAVRLTVKFDLAAGYDGIRFGYLFGSEEYPEYVGQFNDVAGVFLDGANVAKDQSGNDITINGPFFSGTQVVTDNGTEYDGTTPFLKYCAPLAAGPHKVEIVICDVTDAQYDSGLFVAGLAGFKGSCTAGAHWCGDGVVDAGETCDDHNSQPGDGCSSTCTVEPGWTCKNNPGNASVCTQEPPDATETVTPETAEPMPEAEVAEEVAVVEVVEEVAAAEEVKADVAEAQPMETGTELALADATTPGPDAGVYYVYSGGACSAGPASQDSAGTGWLVLALLAGVALVMRRRSSRSFRNVAAGLILVATVGGRASEARADAIDVQAFRPSPFVQDLFTVETGETQGPCKWNVGLFLNYQHDPLVFRQVGPGGDSILNEVIKHQLTANILASYQFVDWFALGIDIPVVLYQAGDYGALSKPSSAGLGDIRLYPRFRLVSVDDGLFTLAISPTISLPTGGLMNDFMGRSSVAFLPTLQAGMNFGWGGFAIDAGVLAAIAKSSLANLNVRHQLLLKGGVWVGAVPKVLDLIAEANVSTTLTDPFGDLKELPVEIDGGLTWHVVPGVDLNVGAGGGLTKGVAAPTYRVFTGVQFFCAKGDEPPPPVCDPDPDGDHICSPCVAEQHREAEFAGVCKGVDKCPDEAEDFDGFEDEDGCPDPDNDKDGICDPWVAEKGLLEKYKGVCKGIDKCPDEAEDFDGFEDEDGCPDPDNDHDKFCDPWVKGDELIAKYKDICHPTDQCPNEPETYNGYKDDDGCPDKAVEITAKKVVILQTVLFYYDKTQIKEESFPLLDEVVQALKDNPQLKKLRIEAHTDSRGKAGYNLKLSTGRAKAVYDYCVSHGVDAKRLTSQGYGATRPLIKDAKTEDDHQKNRRVEFTILEQD